MMKKKEGQAGCVFIDANTKESTEFFAKVIFVNAACLNTNLILLHSTSSRFPNGLGNDNGLLGKFMAFHNYRAGVGGKFPGLEDKYMYGRNPTNPIIANYRNLHKKDTDYLGGFLTFVWSHRSASAFDRLRRVLARFQKQYHGARSLGCRYVYAG